MRAQLNRVISSDVRLDVEAQKLLSDPHYLVNYVPGLDKWLGTNVFYHGATETIEGSVYSSHKLISLVSMAAVDHAGVTELDRSLVRELDVQEGGAGGGRWMELLGNEPLRQAVTAVVKHGRVYVCLPEVLLKEVGCVPPVPILQSLLPPLEVSNFPICMGIDMVAC